MYIINEKIVILDGVNIERFKYSILKILESIILKFNYNFERIKYKKI